MRNVLLTGAGGQGTVLAAKVLAQAAQAKGWQVRTAETIGMAQRGGSVVTYVRFGDKVYSPIIDQGEADYIISFEQLEAARWISYLKPGGQVIVNTQVVEPMPVLTGAASYPEQLIEKMRALGAQVDAIDALQLAEQAGSSKAVNLVLMGRLSRYFDFSEDTWMQAITRCVPQKFLALNQKAFLLGRSS